MNLLRTMISRTKGRIHLVRHGEAMHNADKNLNQHDPLLTDLGVKQAKQLATTFPHMGSASLLMSSPLKRTLQTTLYGFSTVLNERYYAGEGAKYGKGVPGGIDLLIDPDIQERSSYLADTGSSPEVLKELFPQLSFSHLNPDWNLKVGSYSSDWTTVRLRAKNCRRMWKDMLDRLEEIGESRKDIVVVAHGGIIKNLVQDETLDLMNCAWRSFYLEDRGDGDVVLVPAEQGEEAVEEGTSGKVPSSNKAGSELISDKT